MWSFRCMVSAGILVAAVTVAGMCQGAGAPSRDELGRSVKLRIMVDKVMQPVAGWVTEEWMVRETAEAGFNVYSPRHGYDDMHDVKRVTWWCQKYGIYHMPWMRGTLTAPDGAEADGKRVVWASGNEQALWSVNSDEFWAWTAKYIVEYAKISARQENLMGVFLDYENYAQGKEGNLYALSYDDVIMGKFAAAKGIELPELALNVRKQWLDDEGLHEDFEEFQVSHWRERCRALRQLVDECNPRFQFCIYPAPGTKFMQEATYPEWATDEAPLILADACTYGRPSRFISHAEALIVNRERILRGLQVAADAGIPFVYTGGIDPAVRGADPEFSGKNALMISDATDGYWVFYEGTKYDTGHPDYWKWFTWANRKIEAGQLGAWREARVTDEAWSLAMFNGIDLNLAEFEVGEFGAKEDYPPVRFRRENLFVMPGKKGQEVVVSLRHVPLSHYENPVVWQVKDRMMNSVADGSVGLGETGEVRFVAPADGWYLMIVSAGACTYNVVNSNVPVAVYAATGVTLIGRQPRLYFGVRGGASDFNMSIQGYGIENVRAIVHAPDGKVAADEQTSAAANLVKFTVPTDGQSEGVWSLELTKADGGIIEDYVLQMDSGAAPILSLTADEVFGITSE